MKTDIPCKTRSAVESSIKKRVPSIFIATIDITREYAWVVGGKEFKVSGSDVPKGTTYYTSFDAAYKAFNKLMDKQHRQAHKIHQGGKRDGKIFR